VLATESRIRALRSRAFDFCGPACGTLVGMQAPREAAAPVHDAVAEGSRLASAALVEQQSRLRTTAARLDAASPADIHDARVAARRLRSLLATFGPLLEERSSRRLRRRLRDLAGALSGVREADVRRDLLQALIKGNAAFATADAGHLRACLRQSCAEARQALGRETAGKDWMALVEMLTHEPIPATAMVRPDAGLGELLELVDRPWREAGILLARPPRGAKRLHRLRLVLKRCRYALESVSSVESVQAEATLRRLRSAQNHLGDYRDAAQARDWIKVNDERLGRPVARRLDRLLRAREKALAIEAVARASLVMPAYAAWRRATRELRTPGETTRDRA
jgi:CHAD domain-containing protein